LRIFFEGQAEPGTAALWAEARLPKSRGLLTQEQQQITDVPAEPAANNFMATLLRAAWLTILLGIVMEALLPLFAAGFGSSPVAKR